MPSARLVGIAEIAQMFGVSRQRAQQLAVHPSFPKPVGVLKAGRIWRERDVIEWAEARGREVRRADPPPACD